MASSGLSYPHFKFLWLIMERGSSLIEVLVALTLSAIITTGCGTLLLRSMEMRHLAEMREKTAFEMSEKSESKALHHLLQK